MKLGLCEIRGIDVCKIMGVVYVVGIEGTMDRAQSKSIKHKLTNLW